MSLDDYIKKRNFDKSPEPPAVLGKGDNRQFVVQRHQASRLHYDLRLEMEGVLKSWAIPKGPSMNPSDKRLAVRTEDHPVKYLTFEGTIPKGNYGAGEMKIWDTGRYEVLEDEQESDPGEQLKKGNLKLRFHGKNLKGDFALVRTQMKGQQQNWLLIKKQDRHAVSSYDAESIEPPGSNRQSTGDTRFIKPMLASLVTEVFNDPAWIYELKWDGYRVQAHLDHGKVRLFSRNGNSYTKQYPELLPELEGLEQQAILDGEIVVLDDKGKPDFSALQNYKPGTGTLRYYVFDLLHLNGHSTLKLPLLQRKELLQELLEGLETIRYCDHMVGMGNTFYTMAVESGLEGVMAKQKNSFYYPGKRSDDWRKIKSERSLIALICGYTEPEGTLHFGSLVLGRKSGGELEYIGNCGTGFNDQSRKALLGKMKKYEVKSPPFSTKPDLKGRKATWLKPELEAEIKFSEWTKNKSLRHPVFKGLQESVPQAKKTEKANSASKPSKAKGSKNVLDFSGVEVAVTNLEKIYWPESAYMKYDLLEYYLAVSDFILPYLKDRPQNLHRHPDGIRSDGFYQKDLENAPDWVKTYSIYSKSSKRDINYLLCQDEPTLLYMANLGCIEINPWNSRVDSLDAPDWGVIDLDPSPKNTFDEVIEVAQGTRDLLEQIELPAFCKTSGSRGLHIYIPMGGEYSYDEVMNFTKLLCMYILDAFPKLCSMERKKSARKDKIYLDYLQNRRGHSVASPYCLRPKPGAPASAPLEWEELKKGLSMADFNIDTMPDRLKKKGDLFAGVLGEGIAMDVAIEKLEAL